MIDYAPEGLMKLLGLNFSLKYMVLVWDVWAKIVGNWFFIICKASSLGVLLTLVVSSSDLFHRWLYSQVQVTVDGLRGGRQSRDKRRIPSCMCVNLYRPTIVLLCFTVINKEMNQIFFGSLAKFYTSSIWSQIFYFGFVYEPFAHRLTCPLTCLLGDTFLYQQVVTDWTTSYWLCLISMHTNFLWVPGLLQPFCP